jgi:hypothetical protein
MVIYFSWMEVVPAWGGGEVWEKKRERQRERERERGGRVRKETKKSKLSAFSLWRICV